MTHFMGSGIDLASRVPWRVVKLAIHHAPGSAGPGFMSVGTWARNAHFSSAMAAFIQVIESIVAAQAEAGPKATSKGLSGNSRNQ